MDYKGTIMSKKIAVKKAIEAIDSGDARGLRKHINEALVNKVRKALNKKEKQIARNLIESSLNEAQKKKPSDYPGYPQLSGKTNNVTFPSSTECVVFGDGDEGFDEFTDKKVTSGLKPGTKFRASSTSDVLSKLKSQKHQIQPDQLESIKQGAKLLYVFVDPFHVQEDGERVVQIFSDEKQAEDWYKESVNYGG